MVGGHEDASDVGGDELADEGGEFIDRAVDSIRGATFRGRVVAGRVDDVVVDVHGGGALELRAHHLNGVLFQLLVGERTPIGAFEDCPARIDPGAGLPICFDDDLVLASHTEGQLSMREQRGHAKGGDRRQHRVPGVHGDSASSEGAQLVGELDTGLVAERVRDDDDRSPVRAGEEQPIERVDAPTGRRNGDVPCAHAAQGVVSRRDIVGPRTEVALRGVVPVVPPPRVHNEEPRHEGVEGVFTFLSPDGVSAFPEVRIKTPFKGLEGIIAIHGGGRGELSEEAGEGTLLGFEQDSAHCGEEVLRSDRLSASAMPARCFLRSATRALDLKKGA